MTAKLLLLLSLILSTVLQAADDPDPVEVTIAQLIVTPERYAGKAVVVHGFCIFEENDLLLFMSADDAKYENTMASVELLSFHPTNGEFTEKRVRSIHKHMVAIRGVFISPEVRTAAVPQRGGLTEIRYIVPVPEKKEWR